MKTRFIDSIDAVDAARWNATTGTDYPFTRHEFLAAMEHSGATDRESGWQPHHLLVEAGDALIAVMPLYLKYHSWGEYVFDWSWADAYRRHGMDYYPKLLAAIPYTPATGPRLCIDSAADAKTCAAVAALVARILIEESEQQGASSVHVLFPTSEVCDDLAARRYLRREGCQYHWFNRGYSSFDDFLAACSSRKRKTLRKERRRVEETDLTLAILSGEQVDADLWRRFHLCYQLTYAKRSGHGGYLALEFFTELAATMPDQLVMVTASRGDEVIAFALNFRDSDTLYGRYWGCVEEYEFLHFEACYYQGIDYCIAEGLQRFDPGAQGEHKIQRGFEPVPVYSNHWIVDPRFREAIARFCDEENAHNAGYIENAREYLPFKRTPQM